MGKTKDLGHLAHIVTYDASNNITLPANLTVTGTITGYATTASLSSYATQSYVATQISNLVASAPTTLDTLNELATALGNDPNFATTIATSIGTKVPSTRTITINGTAYDLSADRSWNITSMVYPAAGIAVSTGSGWGTSITDNSSNWNTAYSNRIQSVSSPLAFSMGILTIQQANGSQGGFLSNTDWTTFNNKQGAITLTTTGASGAATFSSNTLNIPTYTLSGLGGVPTSRTITINGTAYDLSANREWTVSGTDSTKMPLSGGTFTGPVVFNFTNSDAVEWPRIRFGASSTGWDEGIIKASSAEGVFGRYGMGIHFDSARAFGIYTSSWTKVMGFKSDEVRSFVNLTVNGNSVIHSGNISSQSVAQANQLYLRTAGASVYNANTADLGVFSNYYGGGQISNIPEGGYGSLYTFGGYSNTSLSLQLYSVINHNSSNPTRTLYFRMGNNLGFGNDWKGLLDSSNYTSYVPTNLNAADSTQIKFNSVTNTDYSTMTFMSRAWQSIQGANGLAYNFTTHNNNGGGGYGALQIYYGESGYVYAPTSFRAPVGIFTNDGASRVLYLRGSGNIIQFQDGSSNNKWEVVGREGQFYIYKNDGTGSGYRWSINSSGNHDIYGYFSANGGLGTTSIAASARITVTNSTLDQHFMAAGGAPSYRMADSTSGPSYQGLLGMATYYGHFVSACNPGDTVVLGITSGGRVFITSGANGAYMSWNATSFTSNSDIRLKHVSGYLENALDKIKSLSAIKYVWKSDNTNKVNIGLIAQEVQAVLPELVDVNNDAIGTLGVRYSEMIPVVVKGIQEQQDKIDMQENKINELTNMVSLLQQTINTLLNK